MPTKAELEQQVADLEAKLLESEEVIEALENQAQPTMSIRDTPEGRLQDFVDRCRTEFPVDQIGVLIRSGCKDCKNAGRWDACNKHSWIRPGQCQTPNCKGNHESSAVHLDYVGHAEITARLLELDPMWDWEPVAFDAEGKPVITRRESQASMWIRLTINGISRLGVGTCSTSKDEVEKELIGDALRNAAMRFGLALDLWSKSETLDGSFDREEPSAKAPEAAPAAKQEERADSADSTPERSEGESAAPPPPPAKAEAPASAADLETVIGAFMQLRGEYAKDARLILEDAGLWPVLDTPADRIDEAAGLILPIVDLQKEGGR